LPSIFPDDLFEEKAILFCRIGRHDQALAIYVHKLENIEMAEEYCRKNYNESSEDGKDIYLSLLKVYLHPPVGASPKIDPAYKLLNSHYNKHINTTKALDLLPADARITQLCPFFEAVLRDHADLQRKKQIEKSLRKYEKIQIQFQHCNARSVAINISETRTCPVCKKRIGTSAFAYYPNGIVVHFKCSKDKDVCPVSKQRFSPKSDKALNEEEGLVDPK